MVSPLPTGRYVRIRPSPSLPAPGRRPQPTPCSQPCVPVSMATVDDAIKSQLRNIERATGRSVEEWVALVRANGKERHGEIVAWLKAEHGFSHGNANRVALTATAGGRVEGGADDLVEAMYAGPKSALRAFHDQVIGLVSTFGGDVELAPKKTYVSRRNGPSVSRAAGSLRAGTRARRRVRGPGHRATVRRRAGRRSEDLPVTCRIERPRTASR